MVTHAGSKTSPCSLWHWCCSGMGVSKSVALYGVHPFLALGHLSPCYRHCSRFHTAEVWNIGCQCNIRTDKAVFFQLIVTKIKSFLLCSFLAFLPVKQKNVYREESCNKLLHQLQKQWPTQANFPTIQSWHLRLFNQRWDKARGFFFFSPEKALQPLPEWAWVLTAVSTHRHKVWIA